MDLTPPDDSRGRAEALVPMINVVFLLLVFLLMTAVIVPPDPVPVAPPELRRDPGGAAGAAVLLHVDAAGLAAFAELRGEFAVAAALAQVGQSGARLRLRVDGGLDGAVLARVLADLAARGVAGVGLDVALAGDAP
jgi:biopolymer transport protein ExbD